MGRITDITRQKRNKTRVSIYIDGEFVTGLDEMTLLSNRVKTGDEIEPDELEKLLFESEANSAFERAVGYISNAPRAKREIERYLRDKGYESDVIADVMRRLEDYGYINDYAYAQSYIKSKSKKYGSFRIISELKRKGISDDIIGELLDDDESDAETEGAIASALKYIKSHGNADVRKLKRFLAGRGFSWDSINSATDRLEKEGAFDADDDENYDFD